MTRSKLSQTLHSRGKVHGDYTLDAATACGLWEVALDHKGWLGLSPEKRHSIIMILAKVARILSGDPDHADHWHDIAGYATLVEQRLPKPTTGSGSYTYEVVADPAGRTPAT